MIAIGLALAALIGMTLGLLGGGGSILAVPVFVYVLGFGAKEAIALSLGVVGTVSLFGAAGHWRSGRVKVRVALAFGSVAMVGTYAGARLSVLFSGAAQLALFAGVMLLAAWFMFRGPRSGESAVLDEGTFSWPLLVVEGVAVGVLTGLVGVGGGFLIVPALVLLGGIPMKEAVGTSLLVIAMNSAAGFYGYVGQVEVPWAFLAGFTAVAVVGIMVGSFLVRFVPQATLRRGFAAFLVLIGVFILVQNGSVLVPGSGVAETMEAQTERSEAADRPVAVDGARRAPAPGVTARGPVGQPDRGGASRQEDRGVKAGGGAGSP